MERIEHLPRVWRFCNIYPTAKIGNNTTIGSYTEIGDEVKIGRNCKIGAYSFIPKGVIIEDNCFIGPRTTFTNDKNPQAQGSWKLLYTTVCKGASIGAGSVILPGLTIGSYSMVGAGSVVTRSVLPSTTVVGNPARLIIKEWV